MVSWSFCPLNPGATAAAMAGRGEYPYEDQARHREGEQAEDGGGDHVRLVFRLMGEQTGVHRDEGGRERPFAEEVLQEIRDAEGGPEGVGRIGASKVMRKDAVPYKTGDAAECDAQRHQRCVAARLRRLPRRRRTRFPNGAASSLRAAGPRQGRCASVIVGVYIFTQRLSIRPCASPHGHKDSAQGPLASTQERKPYPCPRKQKSAAMGRWSEAMSALRDL